MTKLEERKTNLRIETGASAFSLGKRREVILEFSSANPDVMTMRLKGTRHRTHFPIGKIYQIALDAEVRAERARKKAKR